MDSIDTVLLDRLQSHGRESWARLGSLTGMTGPAAAERVRRLEDDGVIRGFTAVVNAEALGVSVTAFVSLTLEGAEHRADFIARVLALPEVQECHHVTGDHDYLLKLRCRNTLDLDRLLSRDLKGVPGVTRTRTAIALSTAKESMAVPLQTTIKGERA